MLVLILVIGYTSVVVVVGALILWAVFLFGSSATDASVVRSAGLTLLGLVALMRAVWKSLLLNRRK